MRWMLASAAVPLAEEAEQAMTLSERLSEGFTVFVLGIGTVFAVLILLWLLLEISGRIFARIAKKNAPSITPAAAPAAAPEAPVTEPGIPAQHVAAIAAAIAASAAPDKPRMIIRSIRRAR